MIGATCHGRAYHIRMPLAEIEAVASARGVHCRCQTRVTGAANRNCSGNGKRVFRNREGIRNRNTVVRSDFAGTPMETPCYPHDQPHPAEQTTQTGAANKQREKCNKQDKTHQARNWHRTIKHARSTVEASHAACARWSPN